jgi:hypothetical protein
MGSTIHQRPSDDKDKGLFEIHGQESEKSHCRPAHNITKKNKHNAELLTAGWPALQAAHVKFLLNDALNQPHARDFFKKTSKKRLNHVFQGSMMGEKILKHYSQKAHYCQHDCTLTHTCILIHAHNHAGKCRKLQRRDAKNKRSVTHLQP